MTGLIPIRNRLAYPAGVAPGFNPRHVAANGCVFSVAGADAGGIPINIKSGVRPSLIVSATAKTDGIMGPATAYGTTTEVRYDGPAHGASITAAFVFRHSGAYSAVMATQTGTNGFHIALNDDGNAIGNMRVTIGNPGNSNANTTLLLLKNDAPYFLAVSANNAIYNTIAVSLKSGMVQTSSGTQAGTVGTGGGMYRLGCDWNGPSGNAWGSMASAMASTQFMSASQLLQWAEDPWGFWYPEQNDVGMQATAPYRSRTPVFDTIRRVFPV